MHDLICIQFETGAQLFLYYGDCCYDIGHGGWMLGRRRAKPDGELGIQVNKVKRCVKAQWYVGNGGLGLMQVSIFLKSS